MLTTSSVYIYHKCLTAMRNNSVAMRNCRFVDYCNVRKHQHQHCGCKEGDSYVGNGQIRDQCWSKKYWHLLSIFCILAKVLFIPKMCRHCSLKIKSFSFHLPFSVFFFFTLFCHQFFAHLYPYRELLEQVAEFEKTDFKTTDKVSIMCSSIMCRPSDITVNVVINHMFKVYI